MTATAEQFLALPLRFADAGSAEIAYRVTGAGPPLLCVHGWPLWGFTWRELLPRLAAHRTCYVVDLPGAGDTRWKEEHDFSFRGQARTLARFVDAVGLDRFEIVAQDTGATIARELALTIAPRVLRLALFNTEIPGHRPPWIRFFQASSKLPGSRAIFRALLRSTGFLHSSMGFGNCFCDKKLIDGDFRAHFVQPLVESRARLEGQLRYLRGIDWTLVDGLAERHRELRAPVLFLWGADDPTFPEARAVEMLPQLGGGATLESISGGKLLVHEEKAELAAAHLLKFLT